jgi:hypothetical protein
MEQMVWFSVMGNSMWQKISGIQAPFDGIKGQVLSTGWLWERMELVLPLAMNSFQQA